MAVVEPGFGIGANVLEAMRFEFTTMADGWSWLIALSIGVKILATCYGLYLQHQGHGQVPTWLWWISKLSALTLCGGLVALSLSVGDQLSAVFFALLGLVASVMIVVMSRVRANRAVH